MPNIRLPELPLLKMLLKYGRPERPHPHLLEFIGALAFDLLIGEPPSRLHPVTAISKAIEEARERPLPIDDPNIRRLYTTAATALLPFTLARAALAGTAKWERRHRWLGLAARVYLLKCTFAVGKLLEEVQAVREELRVDNIGAAQERLGSLVSRDRSQLDQAQITSAAIESLAKNLTNSIIAPWLAYALFGLPGAITYRIINTMDALIGLHGPVVEQQASAWLGVATTRFNDLLNFVPARLSALLIAAAAPSGEGDPFRALRIMWRDRDRTGNTNAGWTMSTMAGALGVQLENPGRYVLGEPEQPLEPEQIDRAIRITLTASMMAAATTLLISGLRALLERGKRR